MSDLISRQAAIGLAISGRVREIEGEKWIRVSEVRESLLNTPSAEPERKKGRWIYEGKRGRFPACRCSECGNVENADWAILGDNVNYCPNCGADMREEKEAER